MHNKHIRNFASGEEWRKCPGNKGIQQRRDEGKEAKREGEMQGGRKD